MTYDLHFVPSTAGSEVDVVHAFLEETDGTPSPSRELQQDLATALQQIDLGLERFKFDFEEIARLEKTTVEQAQRRYNQIELNHSVKTGIQITLFPEHATITVPYWHTGASAKQVFSRVRTYAGVLTERGGYQIFDPQLERIVDHFDELQHGLLRTYLGVAERLPELGTPANQRKPWWRFW